MGALAKMGAPAKMCHQRRPNTHPYGRHEPTLNWFTDDDVDVKNTRDDDKAKWDDSTAQRHTFWKNLSGAICSRVHGDVVIKTTPEIMMT